MTAVTTEPRAALHASAPPPSASGGISAIGVRKVFGVTRALDGCNFQASRGEIHAIVGGNGCGKSTLAKVMSGVFPADSGQVSILGHTPASPHEARGLGIGTVFQEVLVADECSVTENLFLGADRLFSRSMPTKEKQAIAGSLMAELAGIDIDPNAVVASLPLSLKQWITIGRAFLSRPRVLILDESSAALDFDSTERLFAKMRALRDEGAAIIIVTHRIAELIRIADRATVLRDGRDVGVLASKEITEKNLLRLMTGKAQMPRTPPAAREVLQGEVVLKAERLRIWPRSHEVNLSLHRGEILGVVGLDGQGQSEFVRVLAGVDRVEQSRLLVAAAAGGFAEIRGLADAVKHGVSYVSGDRKREGIFPNLSIVENLLMPLYRRRARGGKLGIIDWSGIAGAFDWEAEKLSIKMGERGDRITSLSGGNQQKVLIGRAFALNPNVLILNDPARGIDVNAKNELYGHLKDFAATGKSVVYMSSEIEEFVGLCSRVVVFRNGSIFDELTGASVHPTPILHAMFGQSKGAEFVQDAGSSTEEQDEDANSALEVAGPFTLRSPAFLHGGVIPRKYAEGNKVSPPLEWDNAPAGTRSFALSVTDPDLPEAFNFPRAFAHWLIYNIPASVTRLAEGASPGGELPPGAKELASDYVTFKVPGFGRGYGGPWPPDAAHRYVFTLYALKKNSLGVAESADYEDFARAVLPVTITTATIVGRYGPAASPLPVRGDA
jgi:ribose transport system ATP-binding protein